MKTKIFSNILGLLMVGAMAVNYGCIKESIDSVPVPVYTSTWQANTTIAKLKSYNTGTSVGKIGTLAQAIGDNFDIYVEGVVTSNDSCQNFYKTFTIQDETGGIDVKINDSNPLFYTYGFKPGQKVIIHANDLYLYNYNGAYQICTAIFDNSVVTSSGINSDDVRTYIQCDGLRNAVASIEVTIPQIIAGGNTYLQKLITIKNVQFLDATKGYAIPSVTTNRTLIDADNNTIILRNSGFATFASQMVPSGSGSITGVLSVFGTTYQLYIRDTKDVQFTDPRIGGEPPAKTNTIAELKAMNVGSLTAITQDVVIEGVIDGDDESGNLYKQIYIQDESAGIQIGIDATGLYTEFPVGTKIRINCNGLYIGSYGGQVQLGGLYNGAIGRMTAADFYKHVYVIESGLTVDPIATTITDLKNDPSLIGKLIKLSDIQFTESDLGKTWADASATTNRTLVDANGNSILVRTSNFADFAQNTLPSGTGTMVAVLSKYNSDYQLYVRNLGDVDMDANPRIITTLLNEGFGTATLSSPITINGWKDIATAGTKTWLAKEYPTGSGAKYAEASAFSSGQASNVMWLISPAINLTAGGVNYLSFDTEYAYWAAGTTLQAYVSTDFDGTNVAGATWTELTTAKIVSNSTSQNTWVNSGKVDLSAFSGNVYVAFKYTGSGTLSQTTTFRVDNVMVYNLEQQ